jgi:hypothetical protein
MVVFLIGVVWLVCMGVRRRWRAAGWLSVWLSAGAVTALLASPFAAPLYERFAALGSVQFPWRFLSGWQFVPPVVLAILLQQWHDEWGDLGRRAGVVVGMLIVVAVLWLRVPQLYGKNYVEVPRGWYQEVATNLHTVNLNTVWMGMAEDYPERDEQYEIIQGTVEITPLEDGYSQRSFEYSATQSARLVDYSFYYPGWKVTVDGDPVAIEFQDMNYRGVVTYQLPAGEGEVLVRFGETRVRQLAIALSVVTLVVVGVVVVLFRFFSKKIF